MFLVTGTCTGLGGWTVRVCLVTCQLCFQTKRMKIRVRNIQFYYISRRCPKTSPYKCKRAKQARPKIIQKQRVRPSHCTLGQKKRWFYYQVFFVRPLYRRVHRSHVLSVSTTTSLVERIGEGKWEYESPKFNAVVYHTPSHPQEIIYSCSSQIIK
jgi:hypothetical protein